MHSHRIISRDLKPCNILVDMTRGRVKLADFGLARFQLDTLHNGLLTQEVASLWYRAIEVILGSTSYHEGIDLWALGCLIAELYIGHPLFPCVKESHSFPKIFGLLGAPSPIQSAHWPEFELLSQSVLVNLPPQATALTRLVNLAPAVDLDIHRSVLALLSYNQDARPKASELLEAEWLTASVDTDFALSPGFKCPGWREILRRVRETRKLTD